MSTEDESPCKQLDKNVLQQGSSSESLSVSDNVSVAASGDQAKPMVAAATLTNENVTAHSVNGGGQEEREEDGDNSSDVSEISDLSHECWQPVQGPISWVQEQMRKGHSPRKILENLIPKGTMIPEGLDAVMLWKIIINIVSEPPRRKKLENVNTLDDVLHLLRTRKKIIVLTGAGVSVSCGIPDFRSRDGVYARLAKDFPNLPDPQAMFDIHFFKSDPRPFFKFAKEIYPGQFKPSLCHHFIRLLETKDKLLRNYTQNIDTLEQEADIEKVVQCHGSFATASCAVCGLKMNSSAIKEDIFNQVIPQCPSCLPTNEQAVMKPDIVFFGESLPEHFHNQMAADKEECDLLIVIGSSLKVRPVALIPNSLPASVPQILINRERLHYLNFDVELLGDCDNIVGELCRRLGESWDHLVPERPLLDQILITNLPTPPASPDHPLEGRVKNGDDTSASAEGDDGQVSSSSSAVVKDTACANTSRKEHHHHHHHKGGAKQLSHLPSSSSSDLPEVPEEHVSSSSSSADNTTANHQAVDDDMNRLVDAGHRKDVVYVPGKQGTSHHHHHHHHQSSSPSHSSQDKHHHPHHPHHSHNASQSNNDRVVIISDQQQQSGSAPSDSASQNETQTCNNLPPNLSDFPPECSTSSHGRKRSSSSFSSADVPPADGKLGSRTCEPEAKKQKLHGVNTDLNCADGVAGESGETETIGSGCGDSAAGITEGATMPSSGAAVSTDGNAASSSHAREEQNASGSHDEFGDDIEDLQRAWLNRPRISIAERLASHQMLFIPPSRYVFKGAEVYSDESESEDDCEDEDDDDDENEGASSSRDGNEAAQEQSSDTSSEMPGTAESSEAKQSSFTGNLSPQTCDVRGEQAASLHNRDDENTSTTSPGVGPSLAATETAYEGGSAHASAFSATDNGEANTQGVVVETCAGSTESLQDRTDCMVTSTEDLS